MKPSKKRPVRLETKAMSTPAPPQAKSPLSVKEAVAAADRYLREFFPQAQDVRLEEIDRTDDEKYLLVTLGFRDGDRIPGLVLPRDFKVFKIDASSGEVRSMKSLELS